MLWILVGTVLAAGCALLVAMRRAKRRRGADQRSVQVDAHSVAASVSGPPSGRHLADVLGDVAPETTTFAKFHVRLFADSDDAVGSVELENRALDARRIGVTGNDARKLVRLDGTPSDQRPRLMEERLSGIIRDHSASAGSAARKPAIAALLEREFSIAHNTMLCVGANPRHLATPDGIGDGVIAEIKVSSKSWEQTARAYRDELQWQLHVAEVDSDGQMKAEVEAPVSARAADTPSVETVASHEWSIDTSTRMLAAYANGGSILSLSEEFDVRPGVIVHELTRRLLNVYGPLTDATAPRHGDPWAAADSEALCREYHEGVDLRMVAERLGRDQLTIAFQLLNAGWVTVPDEMLGATSDVLEPANAG